MTNQIKLALFGFLLMQIGTFLMPISWNSATSDISMGSMAIGIIIVLYAIFKRTDA